MNLRAMAREATMLFLATYMSIFYANWVSEVNRLSCMMDWGCLVGYERALLLTAGFVGGCLAGFSAGMYFGGGRGRRVVVFSGGVEG